MSEPCVCPTCPVSCDTEHRYLFDHDRCATGHCIDCLYRCMDATPHARRRRINGRLPAQRKAIP